MKKGKNLSSSCYFFYKPNKSGLIFFIVDSALGIEAEILFVLYKKIEAKSPTLSFLRKGNAPMKGLRQIIFI